MKTSQRPKCMAKMRFCYSVGGVQHIIDRKSSTMRCIIIETILSTSFNDALQFRDLSSKVRKKMFFCMIYTSLIILH